jgi:hypothetical protein
MFMYEGPLNVPPNGEHDAAGWRKAAGNLWVFRTFRRMLNNVSAQQRLEVASLHLHGRYLSTS